MSAAAAFAVLAQPPATAQSLLDPMRPPDLREDAATAVPQAASGLQGVVLSPRRHLALINGAVVPMGNAAPDGHKLVDVTDSTALLEKGGERQVLRMSPRIDKKPVRREALKTERSEP
jgi:hypothetical protein